MQTLRATTASKESKEKMMQIQELVRELVFKMTACRHLYFDTPGPGDSFLEQEFTED